MIKYNENHCAAIYSGIALQRDINITANLSELGQTLKSQKISYGSVT